MREENVPPEMMVARIASIQHGVVSVGQLYALGIDKSAISRRVARGRLHRLHRGVYAVGHPGVSQEGKFMAAVLACGEGAALSHRSAASHWELLPAADGSVDVSVRRGAGRAGRTGICLHRSRSLVPAVVVRRDGIPVTMPARTLGDLRGQVAEWQWRKAVRQAEFKRLPLPGIETDRTRSDLERDFLRLCRRFGLPGPEVNVRVGPWTVDFLWRQSRLAVETDGYHYHRGRIAFQDDKVRDLDLRRHGLDVHHFSERQLNEERETVAADLRRALADD